jgi:hypothetical protein
MTMKTTTRQTGLAPASGLTIGDVADLDLDDLGHATGYTASSLCATLAEEASEEECLWDWLEVASSIVEVNEVLQRAQGLFPRLEEAAQWMIGVMLLPALKAAHTPEAAVEIYLMTPDGSPIEILALRRVIALARTREEMLDAYDLTCRQNEVNGMALRKLAEFFLKDKVAFV